MRKFLTIVFSTITALTIVSVVLNPVLIAGMNDRMSKVALKDNPHAIELPEITAPSGNPASNTAWIYSKDNGSGVSNIYIEDDGGNVVNLIAPSFAGDVSVAGDMDIGDAVTDTLSITSSIDANVTLDDGVTASPSLIFKDATDETATLSKADSGDLSITTEAADGLQVLTGNLSVGNGTPDVAIDGEDLYCEGTSEFDGAMRVDGAVTMNSTLAGAGNITLDDGTGASPSLILQDATDETCTISKADSGYTSITTEAADGVSVLVGNLKVGDGTPDTALNGEDAYIEGSFEVDGSVQLDGDVRLDGDNTDIGDAATDTLTITSSIDANITLDDGSGGSPSIKFTDGTDETASFSKFDSSFLNLNTEAADGFRLNGGNWRVGDGSPDVTLDGEDSYLEGTLEVDGDVQLDGSVGLGSIDEVTIATDAITVTKSIHSVDTESDGATDDLSTINGGAVGEVLIITAEDGARTVVIKDGVGNIQGSGDCTLDNVQDTWMGVYDGSNWLELSCSDNGA